MNLRGKRVIAAKLLKCGVNRVWMDPDAAAEIKAAITNDDMRRLINAGAIAARQKVGISSARTKFGAAQKKAGRRSGAGSRKGRKFARTPRKRLWITHIRALRKELRDLKSEGKISRRDYRRLYYMCDSGTLRSRAHLRLYVKQKK